MARRWGSVVFWSLRTRIVVRASSIVVAMIAALCANASFATDSTWVKVGASGKLVYQLDDRGDRIMDFSTVGYYGGTAALPTFSSIVTPDRIITVAPVAGDNLANINAAIAKAATMSVNSNGYRAVVQLAPGKYNISNSININSSGIIFRGSGQGGNPAVDSILAYTALRRSTWYTSIARTRARRATRTMLLIRPCLSDRPASRSIAPRAGMSATRC